MKCSYINRFDWSPQEQYDALLLKQGFVWDFQIYRIKMDHFGKQLRKILNEFSKLE